MLRSRPKEKPKVEESICIELRDKISVFPPEKPVDMNFPYKFIVVLTTIVSSIVVLLPCGHSGAAPAFPHKKCTNDYECNKGEFCRQKFGASYCVPCLDCSLYNREPSRNCARSRTDCGPCKPGFGELGPHCSRQVKENKTTNATYQTSKHDQVATADQSGNSSVWLMAGAILAAAVMTIGVLVYTCRRGVHGATEVPEDEIELAPYRPSAPALENLPKNADSFDGPPNTWANPRFLMSSDWIQLVPRETLAGNPVIPKCYNWLQRANPQGYLIAQAQSDTGDYHSDDAPAADDDNNGAHEVLLGLLENAINQQDELNPPAQVPNDINNGNELSEVSVNLELDAENCNSDQPNAIDGIHENLQAMNNNNNDHLVNMDDDNVPIAPQDLPQEEPGFQFEFNFEVGGLLLAPSPDILEDDPMDAVGPEADQIVPDFPSMGNTNQNSHSGTQDPQQLDEEMPEEYDVEMVSSDEEYELPQ